MRKNVAPGTNKSDTRNNTPFTFDGFAKGIIQDAPASELSNALANGENLTVFPDRYEGRTGCKIFTNTSFPQSDTRVIEAHKSDSTIVIDNGEQFTELDVGKYFNWGSTYELIIGYVNNKTVTVESSTVYVASTLTGSVMDTINAFFWHDSAKVWVLSIGRKLYIAEWDIPSWTEVLVISYDLPFSVRCDVSQYNDFVILFNGNGIFKLEVEAGTPIAYRVNTAPPNIRISDSAAVGATTNYRYLYSASRLEAEGNLVDRQTPSRIACETGTNATDADNLDYAEVSTVSAISPTNPVAVSTLWVPVVPNQSPPIYQQHFTHFPIWRTLDLESKDIADTTRDKYNDPNRYIWVADLRICAAFYVTRNGSLFTASYGSFEVADTYSILELDDGQRFEILEVIDEVTVRVDAEYYEGGAPAGPYAAAIGNGRVIRGSISGSTLTRTHGGVFTFDDVGATLTNSNGYRHIITAYVSPNVVTVNTTEDAPVQGFTIGATSRKFYDTITDEILRARKDFYSCYSRYREGLPSCSLGKIFPGFIVTAHRGQKQIYFSGIDNDKDYMLGQYIPVQVLEEIQSPISFFWLFQNKLAIFCANSTWGISIGLAEFLTLPESGEVVSMLPGAVVLDEHIGSLDPESCREIEGGVVQLVTNEPGGEALRQFEGSTYSQENLLVDPQHGGKIARAFEKTKRLSMAIYDGFLGYILWRKNK